LKSNKIASIKLETAKVVASEWLTEDTRRITVRASGICDGVSPGQFFTIKGWEGNHPLLRRPFSISDIEGNNLFFVIRTTGPGTRLIAEKNKGESISLLGPLGNGFVIAEKVDKHLLIAGGVGIAPFPLLCRALEERGVTDNVELLYGEKSASSKIDMDSLGFENIKVSLASEDGSMGYKGMVTNLLEERLRDEGDSIAIYACGPWAMLREIRLQVGQKRGPLQFSMESHMACGLGSCMGCVIGVKKGEKIIYQRVCRTGPVFDGREVVF
jgi:dihydroorotate dehydrogenase electron transfer subunit